jgi:hypothetical protein
MSWQKESEERMEVADVVTDPKQCFQSKLCSFAWMIYTASGAESNPIGCAYAARQLTNLTTLSRIQSALNE